MRTLFIVLSCIVVPMVPAIAALIASWNSPDNIVEEEYEHDYR